MLSPARGAIFLRNRTEKSLSVKKSSRRIKRKKFYFNPTGQSSQMQSAQHTRRFENAQTFWWKKFWCEKKVGKKWVLTGLWFSWWLVRNPSCRRSVVGELCAGSGAPLAARPELHSQSPRSTTPHILSHAADTSHRYLVDNTARISEPLIRYYFVSRTNLDLNFLFTTYQSTYLDSCRPVRW